MIDEILGSDRIIATVTIEDAALAVPTASALMTGGVRVIEIMLRTDASLDAIRAIRSELPDAIVGAGTVLSPKLLEQAVGAGAIFGVCPGFDGATVTHAGELGVPFLPGAATASEIQACLAHDITTLKFFPAGASGGPAAIRALSVAYSVAGVRFVPTGGVDNTTAQDYLALPSVRAIGMSWLADSAAIRRRDFNGITARSRLITKLLSKSVS